MSRIFRRTQSYGCAVVLGLLIAGIAVLLEPVHAQAPSEQQLKAQEEALLRQLAQAAVEPTARNAAESSAIKASSVETRVEESATELSAEALLNVDTPAVVKSSNQSSDSKSIEAAQLEQLIDQQARAALAAIDQAKSNGSTKVAASKSAEEMATGFVASVSREESPVQQVRKLSTELGSRDAELSGVRLELQNAQKRAAAADARAASLSKQVEALRSKLMVAETEVERLSRVLESRNNSNIAQVTGVSSVARGASAPAATARTGGATRTAATAASPASTIVRERVIVREGKQADDLPVVVVTADKANLRTGPGADNSSLIAVSRGTRLVVETRQGAWFRVFAPNGVRAWVSADTVELQKGAG